MAHDYPALVALLKEARDDAGSMTAVARKIGITTSRYARAVKGEYSFDVLTCLRFARETGVGPLAVLHAAGKHEIAELLRAFFEAGEAPCVEASHVERHLTPAERTLLEAWHGLPLSVQEPLATLIEHIPKPSRRSRRT